LAKPRFLAGAELYGREKEHTSVRSCRYKNFTGAGLRAISTCIHCRLCGYE
jgi:hypothetical protein